MLQRRVLVKLSMGLVRWAHHSAVSGAFPPTLRLTCAFRARPKYAQHEASVGEVQYRDPDTVVGSWALLKGSTVEQGRGPAIQEPGEGSSVATKDIVERGGQSRRT